MVWVRTPCRSIPSTRLKWLTLGPLENGMLEQGLRALTLSADQRSGSKRQGSGLMMWMGIEEGLQSVIESRCPPESYIPKGTHQTSGLCASPKIEMKTLVPLGTAFGPSLVSSAASFRTAVRAT